MPYLNLKQVAKHLGISEKTVYRLIARGELPAVKVGRQWRFNRQEMESWLRRERPEVYLMENINEFLPGADSRVLIYNLLKSDRIFFRVPGRSREEVLGNAIGVINLEPQINRKELLAAIIDREKLCSTGIGHGIALPHPRHPHNFIFTRSSIHLCFLERKIDFDAVDRLPVDKLFFVFGRTEKEHLHMLKVLARLFHEKGFLQLLDASKSQCGILDNIKQLEEDLRLRALALG
jgi:PTS system nitrogen regulatory IIA component